MASLRPDPRSKVSARGRTTPPPSSVVAFAVARGYVSVMAPSRIEPLVSELSPAGQLALALLLPR